MEIREKERKTLVSERQTEDTKVGEGKRNIENIWGEPSSWYVKVYCKRRLSGGLSFVCHVTPLVYLCIFAK